MSSIEDLRKDIRRLANPEKAKASAWFFKTKEGEYGYGDLFLGLTVPQTRLIAKKYTSLSLDEVITLLQSQYHEERQIALFLLIHSFKKGNKEMKKRVYEVYLANTLYVNNWDLVDSSAPRIVGEYLWLVSHSEHSRVTLLDSGSDLIDSRLRGNDNQLALKELTKLAHSDNLWERRIAIIATFGFIKYDESSFTYKIAEVLLHDTHDLIHKAVGWALREAGKRVSEEEEKHFLDKYYKTMPRTMLRYAIERFGEEERRKYLAK